MVEFSMFPEEDDLESRVRTKASNQLMADASSELDDLLKSFKKPEEEAAPVAAPPVDDQPAAPADGEISLEDMISGMTPKSDDNFAGKSKKFLKEVARGAGSTLSTMSDVATSVMVHGPLEAVDSAMNLADELGVGWMADKLEEAVPLGGYQLYDEKGEFDFKILAPWEYKYAKVKGAKIVPPEVPDALKDFFGPRTTAGNITSDLSQFGISMYMGGKVIPAVGEGSSFLLKVGREMARGGLATFVGFQAHEERLSNLIQQYPSLANPISEWLAADKETPALMDRLKAGIEGEALGPVGAGVFKTFIGGLRMLKQMRASVAGRGAKTAATSIDQTAAHQFIKEWYSQAGRQWDGKLYRSGEINADEFGAKTTKTKVGAQSSDEITKRVADNRAMRDRIYDDTLKRIESGDEKFQTKEELDAWKAHYDELDTQAEETAKAGGKEGEEVTEERAGVFFHTDREGAQYYGDVNHEFDQFQMNSPMAIVTDGDQEAMKLAAKYGIPAFDLQKLLKSAKITESGDVATDIQSLLPHIQKMGRFDGVLISGPTGAEVTGAPLEAVLFRDPRLSTTHAPAKSKPVRYIDPDDIIGDANAPLIGDNPTGIPAKLREVMEKAGDESISREELETIAAGATPIKIGKEPVYINFSAINSTTDLHQVIQHLTNQAQGQVDKARRGIVSWSKTSERASAIDGWEVVLERRKGSALNAEQLLATRELWITAADKTMRLAKLVAQNPKMENVYAARRMTAIFQMINAEVLGATAEAGRALNIMRKPVGVTGDALPKYLQSALDTVGGKEMNETFFRNLAAMSDDPDAYAKLVDKVEPTNMQRVIGGLQDFWIGGSLLSGPKTQMRNLLSNLATTANEALEREIAGRMGVAMGSPAAATGEGLAYLIGATGSIKQAVVAAGRAMWRNESAFGATQFDVGPSRLSSKGTMVEGTPIGWAVDALGVYSSLAGRAMISGDEFFKTVNQNGEIGYLAFRESMDEVSRGVISREEVNGRIAELMAHPTPQMKAKAFEQAHRATFTSPPGEITKGLLSIAKAHPVMRWIAPFIRTPSNLFKYAFERTPLGFTTKRYKEAIEAGGHEATLARTRIGLGTIVTLSMLDLALEGKIIGNPAEYTTSPSEKDWLRTNSMPYTLRIPMGENDVRHFSYQGIDPFGLSVGMAANLAEAVRVSQDGDFNDEDEEKLGAAFSSMMFYAADYALSRSYMTGVTDFVQAAVDPGRNAERWTNKFAASWVPNWMGEMTRAIDPSIRDASDLTNSVLRKTLFMSNGVPMIRDRFGRTSTYESGLGTAYDVVSPFYSKRVQVSPWEQEEKRQGFYVGAPSSDITIDKVKVSMSDNPAMYLELKKIRGQMKPSEMGDFREAKRIEQKYGDINMFDLLNAIVEGNHPLYLEYAPRSDGKDNEKDAFIDKIVRDYSKAAKIKLFRENVQLQMMYEQASKRKVNRDERIE